jgi:lipopolysaccharide export system protein LptA
MPLPVYRLRRWLAVIAVLFTAMVAGMYFYARSRALNVLKQIPNKIGIDIKQTARGFQFSKSDGKRTLFTIEATDLKELRLNGHTELHNVSIVLYGRDSSRFDQIYGDEFAYDPKTGDIRATGEVQIDLEANPGGLSNPDQTTPKELKNPIHLKTRDLVFNRETGNASTEARVEFSAPQATGWAVGVQYESKANTLSLESQIHVVVNGPSAATIEASHATVTNEPRQIVLDNPRVRGAGGMLQADRSVFFLGEQNEVQRILATGNVAAETRAVKGKTLGSRTPEAVRVTRDGDKKQEQPAEIQARADQAEFLLTGPRDVLRTATLSGNVHIEQSGAQAIQGDAGRVALNFAGQSQLQMVYASENVRLRQNEEAKVTNNAATSQDFELTSSTIDFSVAQGHVLTRAVTGGAARLTLASDQDPTSSAKGSSAKGRSPQRTVVTAGKFEANFVHSDQARNRLSSIHGTPDARIVSSTPGQPDRISTSRTVEAAFLPQGGIESITQQGNVEYSDGQPATRQLQAWADRAKYIPSDELLTLEGSPRVASNGMATTATTIRMNRTTGDALAEGDVKSTYSELKEQPNGALLASSSPIHVTAHSMTAHSNPTVALYSGKARLWQDANIIEAPTIQFDRDRRFVTAQGTPSEPVQTILVQAAKPGTQAKPVAENKSGNTTESANGKAKNLAGSSPIVITAAQLSYADSDRKAHYDGGVVAKGSDFTASANTVDAYLLPRSQTATNESLVGTGQLDRMEADGSVLIHQNGRHAEGQKLVYTVAEDKFVLSGGPPSIFDAEQGKITGVSLTFFRGDDRVLVEGKASTPVVTQTRVAR